MRHKIIIGSGGTGGHMFPAAAIAEQLREIGYDIILITDSRGMRFGKDFADDHIVELPIINIRKGGIGHKIKSLFHLLHSIFTSVQIIRKHRAKAVIGFGGYPSFPAAMAGFLTGRRLFLHEQNAILGRTNKFLKKFAHRNFTSFANTKYAPQSKKVIFTGNPVRQALHPYADAPYPETQNKFHILVTGGSQGASIFSEVMPEVCTKLPKDLRHKLHVTHQARAEDLKDTQAAYKAHNIQADVVTFIEDMGQAMAQSHLIICRSGASTLVETGFIGRPALYVPLPYAADDQQTINAQIAVDLGAGRLIRQDDFSPSYVASFITNYYMNPETLKQAANAAKGLSKKDAGHNIAQIIGDILQKS